MNPLDIQIATFPTFLVPTNPAKTEYPLHRMKKETLTQQRD